MILGIDAHTIRSGGGLAHLYHIVKRWSPGQWGIDNVVVVGSAEACTWLSELDDVRCVNADESSGRLVRTRGISRWLDELFKPYDPSRILSLTGMYAGRYPHIFLSHNMLVFEEKERARYGWGKMLLKFRLLERFQSKSLRSSIGAIFLSDYTQDYVLKKYPVDIPTIRIYHGIEKKFRSRESKYQSASWLDRDVRLLYVSNLTVYKHQIPLINAVARYNKLYSDQNHSVHIELVGGSYEPYARNFRKAMERLDKEEQSRIHYIGKVAYEEMPSVYARSDGFIFSSTCENMPNILIEAMMSGMPVLSSKYGPMPEILGPKGFYFDPVDVEDTVRGIRDFVLNKEARQEQIKENEQRVSIYDWDHCADKTFTFISSI